MGGSGSRSCPSISEAPGVACDGAVRVTRGAPDEADGHTDRPAVRTPSTGYRSLVLTEVPGNDDVCQRRARAVERGVDKQGIRGRLGARVKHNAILLVHDHAAAHLHAEEVIGGVDR